MVFFRNFEIRNDEILVFHKMRDLFCFVLFCSSKKQLHVVVAKLHKQNVYFQAF